MNFLVVEQSELVRARLVELVRLAVRRVRTLESSTAEDTMRIVKSLALDVVLLDLDLPEGHGFRILTRMKSSGVTTPVVVLTNQVQPQLRERCFQLGVLHFFDKSHDFEAAVEAAVRLARQGNSRPQRSGRHRLLDRNQEVQ